jgi:hypothetical protein
MAVVRLTSKGLKRAAVLSVILGGVALVAPPVGMTSVSHMVIDTFEHGGLAGWIERRYNGRTLYKVVKDGGNKMLMAQSRASASALGKIVRFDPGRFSHLEWRWRIDDIIENGNALRPDANDHAAGVYVLFARGKLPWQVDVIEYIWANALPKGHCASHPTQKNIRLMALESGRQRARQWVWERRNLAEDYRSLFESEPPPVVAVAIMTDTDQTGAHATAYYDDFIVRR